MLALTLCITGMALSAVAAPWDLDPTFGNSGNVIWSPNGNTESRSGSDVALQADGKIVMVGGASEIVGASRCMVVRFNSNGSIDSTFGTGGWTTVTFGTETESAVSVAVQPDGKIVVGGYISGQAGFFRLNPDGSLDTTFSDDGKTIILFQGGTAPVYLSVVKIAQDGKIVFAGTTPIFNNLRQGAIGRLNPDGLPDATFSGDGRVINGGGSWVDLVTQADGTIFLAGFNSTQGATYRKAAKYSNNGAEEWSYYVGQDGQSTAFNGIAAQPDGKLVLAGRNVGKIFALRLNPDGGVDNTFSSTTVLPDGQASSAIVQPDGKIVFNVGFGSDTNDGFSLLRLNTDGILDSGFGNGGVVTTRITSNGIERGARILLQPDGKLLVGGRTGNAAASPYRFAMVRYRGSSAVPQQAFFDYDGDGKSDVSVFRPSENKWYVLRSSDYGVTQQVFAISGDVPIPADFDGDRRTDFTIYRPSNADWWSLSTANGNQVYAHWGESNAIARPSDFDGDGKADYIYFLPTSSTWYRYGSIAGLSNVEFGLPGDKPLTGDFDGDGKSDVAIYRPSTGDWWYGASSAGGQHRAAHWGISTDVPAPADYDGDGKTDHAVYRPETGAWYIANSSDGSYTILSFGISETNPFRLIMTVMDEPTSRFSDHRPVSGICCSRPPDSQLYSSGYRAISRRRTPSFPEPAGA